MPVIVPDSLDAALAALADDPPPRCSRAAPT